MTITKHDKLREQDDKFRKELIDWLMSCHQGDFSTGTMEQVSEKFNKYKTSNCDAEKSIPGSINFDMGSICCIRAIAILALAACADADGFWTMHQKITRRRVFICMPIVCLPHTRQQVSSVFSLCAACGARFDLFIM